MAPVAGVIDSEKRLSPTTEPLEVAVCEPDAAVPMTVMGIGLLAVPVSTEIVNVVLPPSDVTVASRNVPCTPAGSAPMVSAISSALPLLMVVSMLKSAEPPGGMVVSVGGVMAMVKSSPVEVPVPTATIEVVPWLVAPAVPVTLNVVLDVVAVPPATFSVSVLD